MKTRIYLVGTRGASGASLKDYISQRKFEEMQKNANFQGGGKKSEKDQEYRYLSASANDS